MICDLGGICDMGRGRDGRGSTYQGGSGGGGGYCNFILLTCGIGRGFLMACLSYFRLGQSG